MNILPNQLLLFITLFLCEPIFAQNENLSDYYLIQRKYENRLENDSTALPLVNELIKKAKAKRNFHMLFQGYKDGLVFSPNPRNKLKYADSVIWAATKTKDDHFLSNAYLNKGVVYYFNFKQYKLALDQYLIAYNKCKNGKDRYHKNRLKYLIGVVKSYIGYYDEALNEFKGTSEFFEGEIKKDIHPNLMYNNQRGYFNTLHQMAICYRKMGNYKSADSIVNLGISNTFKVFDYKQEHAYFLKEKGIGSYYHSEYEKAINLLNSSIESLTSIDDFATATVAFSYIGKAELKLGSGEKAAGYFEKIDSIFERHAFILPEVISVYEILIDHYRAQGNLEKVTYYTKQLIKADKIISRDFVYLSSEIHSEYDSKKILEQQDRLERKKYLIGFFLFVFLLSIITGIFWKMYKKKLPWPSVKSYYNFDFEMADHFVHGAVRAKQYNRLGIEKEIIDNVLLKLEEFEEKHEYIESGMTLQSLASKVDTNVNYLSNIINECKGVNFNRYIIDLRIAYITEKLYREPKYLKYTIQALSEECGISSRSNFSKWFQVIHGIRPADFIKKRLEDISNNKGDI